MLDKDTSKYPYGLAAVLIGVYALLAVPPLVLPPRDAGRWT